MPHFKCVACKLRVHSAGDRADLLDDLCPGCGSPFEPAAELAELVGFPAIASSDPIDTERWADDGGGAMAETAALPRPETTR